MLCYVIVSPQNLRTLSVPILHKWHIRRKSIQWFNVGARRGRDRMVVKFTTTYVITAYHHWCCEFGPRSWRGVIDTTLCDKVCQWLATGFLHQLKWPPRYNWNIVESGVKHHKPSIFFEVKLGRNVYWIVLCKVMNKDHIIICKNENFAT